MFSVGGKKRRTQMAERMVCGEMEGTAKCYFAFTWPFLESSTEKISKICQVVWLLFVQLENYCRCCWMKLLDNVMGNVLEVTSSLERRKLSKYSEFSYPKMINCLVNLIKSFPMLTWKEKVKNSKLFFGQFNCEICKKWKATLIHKCHEKLFK